MARIALIEPDNAAPEVKETYEKVPRGKPGNAQKALAHRPEMLKNFLPFYASVGRDDLASRLYVAADYEKGDGEGCCRCRSSLGTGRSCAERFSHVDGAAPARRW
jgi:hypothetical protein